MLFLGSVGTTVTTMGRDFPVPPVNKARALESYLIGYEDGLEMRLTGWSPSAPDRPTCLYEHHHTSRRDLLRMPGLREHISSRRSESRRGSITPNLRNPACHCNQSSILVVQSVVACNRLGNQHTREGVHAVRCLMGSEIVHLKSVN